MERLYKKTLVKRSVSWLSVVSFSFITFRQPTFNASLTRLTIKRSRLVDREVFLEVGGRVYDIAPRA